jgi:hypothetical protein
MHRWLMLSAKSTKYAASVSQNMALNTPQVGFKVGCKAAARMPQETVAVTTLPCAFTRLVIQCWVRGILLCKVKSTFFYVTVSGSPE